MEAELQSPAGVSDAGACDMSGCRIGMHDSAGAILTSSPICICPPLGCVDAVHRPICKDTYHDSNVLYRLSGAVKSNKTHHNHKMKIKPTKPLYNIHYKSQHMDKNERVRLRLSVIRKYHEGLSNSCKNHL